VTIELPGQPLVAVDVDLDLKRKTTLELDVDEPPGRFRRLVRLVMLARRRSEAP
jgi:hypothetical protein